jgi:hypothetical protein
MTLTQRINFPLFTLTNFTERVCCHHGLQMYNFDYDLIKVAELYFNNDRLNATE